jgi:glycosyltransferase involved in cell wall biosynthesis
LTPSRDARQAWRGIDILVVSPTPTHPQDYGNRKRFFELCVELKRQGAGVHYVHYASEHDWRHDRPARFERQMMDAWDSYQLVAPSRPLHMNSIGPDHTIDEWADPALTSYIRWAFSVRRYDVVIVGYTWMSFCFDAVPEGVFKICDTNDVFGGRRAILEANGVAPEFFHTTQEEEAKGLGRADLVWAIKDIEQRYFEKTLGVKQALTLLYAEPERNWWREPPSKDGWFRVGIMGGRNNVNRRNFEGFLVVVLPLIVTYMAPIKICIGGSCSEDFKSWRHPNLEIVGRVADVSEFYAAMDIIAAPMQFSTGLKIKVAEALASGAPLIAHEHAMEGYPPGDRLHTLPDFKSMAQELVKLSFDRSSLPALSKASSRVCKRVQSSVLETLEQTRKLFVSSSKTGIMIVAPMEALDERGLLHDHLYATINYVRHATSIALYLVGPAAKIDWQVLSRYGFQVSVFLEESLARDLGESVPDRWRAMDFPGALSCYGISRAYFLCGVPGLEMLGSGVLKTAFIRYDAVKMSGENPEDLVTLLSPITRIVVLSSSTGTLGREISQGNELCQVPFRRNNAFTSFSNRLGASGSWGGMLILAEPGELLISALENLARQFDIQTATVDVDDTASLRQIVKPSTGALHAANVAGARLIVDLTQAQVVNYVIAEGARRAGIPYVRLARGANAGRLQYLPQPARPTTIAGLIRTAARALVDDHFREQLVEIGHRNAHAFSTGDAGWTVLWGEMTRAEVVGRAESASSFFG